MSYIPPEFQVPLEKVQAIARQVYGDGWIEGPPIKPGDYEIELQNGKVFPATTHDDGDIVRHRPTEPWEDMTWDLLMRKLEAVIARAGKAEAELAAAQQREAKLLELCEAQIWLYPYQVLKILDGKEGE